MNQSQQQQSDETKKQRQTLERHYCMNRDYSAFNIYDIRQHAMPKEKDIQLIYNYSICS